MVELIASSTSQPDKPFACAFHNTRNTAATNLRAGGMEEADAMKNHGPHDQPQIAMDRTFPLADAAAHRFIESRRVFGRVVLMP